MAAFHKGEKVTVLFKYGHGYVRVLLPAANILPTPSLRCAPAIPDVNTAVREAMQRPLGTLPLRDLARNKQRITILFPDRTRPIPVRTIISAVLEELQADPGRVTLICAVGTHRGLLSHELCELVGATVYARYAVMNHDARDDQNLVKIGQSSHGMPIVVNRTYAEADLKIAIGGVRPHGVVGWGGGAKLVLPGVAGEETIGYLHWRSFPSMGRDVTGIVETPLRLELEDAVDRIGLDFLVAAAPNRDGEIMAIFAGDFRLAFRAACRSSAAANDFIFSTDVGPRADILICGTDGLDMWNGGTVSHWLAEYFLKPGGTIVQFCPCSEGVSRTHPEVAHYGYLPPHQVEHLVAQGKITDLVAATHMAYSGRVIEAYRCRSILYTEGLSPEQVRHLGLVPARSPQEAVEMALEEQGAGATIRLVGSIDLS